MSEATFRSVGVVAKHGSREAVRIAADLGEWLRRRERLVAFDTATLRAVGGEADEAFQVGHAYDLVIVLGGDGTLLSVARELPEGVPLLGVNMGRLGFLTELSRHELYPNLVHILAGRYTLEERSLLQVELVRNGGQVNTLRALNDAVIAKGARSRIIEMDVHVDGHRGARYRADGLILSTPTGSTAYNLSAAGPILHPRLPVVVMTPICPHTLSLRPMVVPDSVTIEVTLETRREEVYLTVDGQEGTTLGYRDRVRVTRSPWGVRLVKTTGRTFFDSLRGKLRWGEIAEPGAESP